jgi:hypothetical protein
MTYNPVRAITSAEIAKMRSDGQYTRLRAVIIPQQTILSCHCTSTLSSNDAVSSVPIAIDSGSATDVKYGMTAYVGSSAGASDLGMVRVKSATTSALKIGRTSEIIWTTSVYITVVDDFGIWAKLPTMDTTVIDAVTELVSNMDDDVVYSDQNTNMNPIPILGPDLALPYSVGMTVPLDGSNSYELDGSGIASYQWAVRNGATSSGSIDTPTASTANWTPAAAGSYTLELTIVSGNGKTSVGHRSLYLYDLSTYKPVDQLTVDTLTGSRDDGGWEADLTLWDQVALPGVKDRAKVILISDDYYSGVKTAISQYKSGSVVMVGWIAGETIEYDREKSTVKFTVYGPAWWLKQCTGPSTYLQSQTAAPTDWFSFNTLTFDKCLYHWLYWRSTAMEVIDVYPCGNTRVVGGMSASIGAIYDQLQNTAQDRLLTYICADKFGRLFPYIDPQVLSSGDRSSLVTVQEVTNDDLTELVSLQRQIVKPVSQLEVAALSQSGDTVNMFMSRAPGSLIYSRFGQNDQNDRLIVSDQSDANNLAGMLLAKKNNEYASEHLTFGQINWMLDIAPGQYFTLSASAVMNARNISFTDKKFIPVKIDYKFDPEKGSSRIEVDCEGETSGNPGYTVNMPAEPIYNLPEGPEIAEVPLYPISGLYGPSSPYSPKQVSDVDPNTLTPCRDGTDTSANGPFIVPCSGELPSTNIYGLIISFPGYLRPSSSPNPTRYQIDADWLKLVAPTAFPCSLDSVEYDPDSTDNWYSVYALNSSGTVVATGVHDAVTDTRVRTGVFNNAAGVDFSYIKIIFNPVQSMAISSVSPAWYNPTPYTNGCGGWAAYTYFSGTPTTNWDMTPNGGVHVLGQGYIYRANPGDGFYGWAAFGNGLTLTSPSSSNIFVARGYVYNNPYWGCDIEPACGVINGTGDGWIYKTPGQVLEPTVYDAAHMNSYQPGRIGGSFQINHSDTSTHTISAEFFVELLPNRKINFRSFTLWNICAHS